MFKKQIKIIQRHTKIYDVAYDAVSSLQPQVWRSYKRSKKNKEVEEFWRKENLDKYGGWEHPKEVLEEIRREELEAFAAIQALASSSPISGLVDNITSLLDKIVLVGIAEDQIVEEKIVEEEIVEEASRHLEADKQKRCHEAQVQCIVCSSAANESLCLSVLSPVYKAHDSKYLPSIADPSLVDLVSAKVTKLQKIGKDMPTTSDINSLSNGLAVDLNKGLDWVVNLNRKYGAVHQRLAEVSVDLRNCDQYIDQSFQYHPLIFQGCFLDQTLITSEEKKAFFQSLPMSVKMGCLVQGTFQIENEILAMKFANYLSTASASARDYVLGKAPPGMVRPKLSMEEDYNILKASSLRDNIDKIIASTILADKKSLMLAGELANIKRRAAELEAENFDLRGHLAEAKLELLGRGVNNEVPS